MTAETPRPGTLGARTRAAEAAADIADECIEPADIVCQHTQVCADCWTARPTVDGITLWGSHCYKCDDHIQGSHLCEWCGDDLNSTPLWAGDVDHLIAEHKALQAEIRPLQQMVRAVSNIATFESCDWGGCDNESDELWWDDRCGWIPVCMHHLGIKEPDDGGGTK